MSTGDGPYRLTNSGGGLPTGLVIDTNYWIIKITADTFQFASSLANALALTPVTLSGDGTGTQTINRGSNDVIMAQLNQALNAVVGANYASVQSGSSGSQILTVTATAPGNWFSLEILSRLALAIAQTHVDPGYATTLAAIVLENSDWYALVTLYNSAAVIAAVAGFIETQAKIYLADSCDSAVATGTVGNGDALDALHTLARTRSSGWFHPSPAMMLASAEEGQCLPLSPGSETWMFKTLSGVAPVALTPTELNNISNKKANTYVSTAGDNMTSNGFTADGRYIDSRRGLDSLTNDLQVSIFNAMSQLNKVPMTNKGVTLIENVIRGAVERAITAGILSDDPADAPTYSVPKVQDIDDSDKAARLLPDMDFTAVQAGAVQKTIVNGNVSL